LIKKALFGVFMASVFVFISVFAVMLRFDKDDSKVCIESTIQWAGPQACHRDKRCSLTHAESARMARTYKISTMACKRNEARVIFKKIEEESVEPAERSERPETRAEKKVPDRDQELAGS